MARPTKPTRERQRALPLEDQATHVLPVQLRVGDVVFDRGGNDWEVVSRPVTIQRKSVTARVRVPGKPETEKEERWDAYRRVSIRRRVGS